MKLQIKNKFNNSIIYECEGGNLKDAVIKAIEENADLHYADLRHADLRHVDLYNADLRHVDLRHADLRHADLRHANLYNADLHYADLRHADLRHADLHYADLRHADLRHVDLITFQFQRHHAFYTFDGTLRIGCIVLPISEWVDTFEQIGLHEQYTDEQIDMYGHFINICYKHFLNNT